MELMSIIGVIGPIVDIYGKMLSLDYRSAGDRFDRTRVQLLTQQTRLQYVGDFIQSGDLHLSLESESLLVSCLKAIQEEFSKLSKIEQIYPTLQLSSSSASRRTQLSSLQKFRWNMRDRERVQDSLNELTILINQIESILRLFLLQPKDFGLGSETGTATISSIPVEGRRLRDENTLQTQGEAQELFRSLCHICEKSLRVTSSGSATLRDTFLSYLLWAQSVNSENVVALFTQLPAEIDDQKGPDLLKIHYELLARMAWILIQTSEAFDLESGELGKETLSELYTILSKVQDAGIKTSTNESWKSERYEDNSNEAQIFVSAELAILVDSLMSSLPSLLQKSQLQQVNAPASVHNAVSLSLESEVEQQAPTKELFDVAVQLTTGISKAFDEMYNDRDVTSWIPVEESLRDLYSKEVAALLKWKEANGPKLGGKMTSQNQGVWEALQATIFNMTDLLNSMSSQATASNAIDSTINVETDTLLADYAQKYKQLDLAIEAKGHQDMKEMIRDFSDFVRTLVDMEAPLGAIEPPPTYEKRHGDQIIVNTGDERIQATEGSVVLSQ